MKSNKKIPEKIEAYAVANAVPECKECAADVIGGNDEDGVALWLQEHFNDNMVP